MKKISLLALLIYAGTFMANAQQDPQFTQFFFNKLIMNPAYAGSNGSLCFTALYRNQWSGLTGAPQSGLLSGDMPIWNSENKRNQIAMGFTTYFDFLGFERNYAFRVSGAYRRMNLGPGNLSVGIDLGMSSKGIIDGAGWITPGAPEPNLPNGQNNIGFDLDLGVYYNTQNWYAGVSALHLTASDFADVNVRQARHMFFMGGYTFKGLFGRGDFDLNPNALIKTDFATAQFDLNCNVIYRGNYWGGLTYRVQDAVAINLGMDLGAIPGLSRVSGLLIGYSYDINTSRLSSFNSGSHEISLRYCLRFSKKVPIPGHHIRFLDILNDAPAQ